MKQLSGGIYTVVKYGLLVIALIMVMILQYVFPLLAKFRQHREKTQSATRF